MSAFEAIKRAQATNLVDEDGDEVELELLPALPPADVESLADEIGVPLPRELRVLLERTSGIDGGPLDTIDFTGRSLVLVVTTDPHLGRVALVTPSAPGRGTRSTPA
jgi:hypothetical protein